VSGLAFPLTVPPGLTLSAAQAAAGARSDKLLSFALKTPKPANVIAVLGDSLVWNGSTGITVTSGVGAAIEGQAISATNCAITSRNIVKLACFQLGYMARCFDRGVSGERTDQWLARFDTDIKPLLPDWVAMVGCSNDFDQLKTAQQVYDNIVAIFQKALSIGAQTVFFNTSCGNYGTQAIADNWYTLHLMLQWLHEQQIGFFYVPMYPRIVDYSTNTGGQLSTPKTGRLKDSRHPAALGAFELSQNVVAFFKPLFFSPFSGSGGARWNASAGDQDSSIIANGIFAGPGVAASGGPTGTDPTFWTTTKTGGIAVACSLVPRTDGRPGQWARHTLSGATALSDLVTMTASNSNNAGFLAPYIGEKVIASVDVVVNLTTGTLAQLDMQLQLRKSDTTNLVLGGANMILGTEYLGYGSSGQIAMTLVTEPFTVPALADRACMIVREGTSVGGAGTVDWGAANVRRFRAAA